MTVGAQNISVVHGHGVLDDVSYNKLTGMYLNMAVSEVTEWAWP